MRSKVDASTIILIFQGLGLLFGVFKSYQKIAERLTRIETKIESCPHVNEGGLKGEGPLVPHKASF